MTGKCPECGFCFRLRKDGTIMGHRIYFGPRDQDWFTCSGAGRKPKDAAS